MNTESSKLILEFFNIKFRETNSCFYFVCPIHEGADNPSGVNLYKGDKGYWVCNTGQCHQKYQKNIIGFVRAILENKNNRAVSYREAENYCKKILNSEIVLEKPQNFDINKIYIPSGESVENSEVVNFIDKTEIPSLYYIGRGFDFNILNKYEVGDCFNRDTKMYGRAVFPLYNLEKTDIIGYTGRAVNDKCKQCSQYHPGNFCNPFPKWKHLHFSRQKTLFNIWFAKEKIKETKTVILVESPNCVLKLESFGIQNSVAFVGSSLSYDHLDILNSLGVMNIILIGDNDEAGGLCKKQTIQKCKGLYNLKIPKLDYHDIDDCPPDYIIEKLLPKIYQTC